jgi:metallo-beta-lactamase class B
VRFLMVAARFAAFAALACSGVAHADDIHGCASKPIRERFEEFGRTGRMPPDLGRWLSDPKEQVVQPYQAFDNVYYVGLCWVSA